MSRKTEETLDLFVIVDENGDYGLGADYDEAKESYEHRIGELGHCEYRTLSLKATVPLPKPLEVSFAVPEQPAGELAVTVS